MKPPYAIGSVPSLSGHATAYRWRSLPRVRRHRASKSQGSSERVLPWQVTMDQLIFASLSHTHYWYEVGMLKVPAYQCEWHRMTRMTGSDCVICNLIYIHTHTHSHTYRGTAQNTRLSDDSLQPCPRDNWTREHCDNLALEKHRCGRGPSFE